MKCPKCSAKLNNYEQFKHSAAGAIVNNLNIDRVKNTKIPISSIKIQTQIV